MIYKRYIKKKLSDGTVKLRGPYYYENWKENGKVRTRYIGPNLPKSYRVKKKRDKDIIKGFPNKYLIFLGVVLLLGVAFFNLVYVLDVLPTGKISMQVDTTPVGGETLKGSVTLNMVKGELIPAETQVIVDNSGERYEYFLKDLLFAVPVEGNFYMREKILSGFGKGFGIVGSKEIYPEVNFKMRVVGLKPVEKLETKLPLITGEAIINDNLKEIEGFVSQEFPFTYELQPGEQAEIIFSEHAVYLEVIDNLVIVTTDYAESEDCFGEDCLGDDVSFSFDLEDLRLIVKSGEFKISFVYGGEELLSTSKNVGGEVIEKPIEEPEPELEPPLMAEEKAGVLSQIFFEDCVDISDWDIFGGWMTNLPEQCYTLRTTSTDTMTSAIIDLSNPDISYANLSFNYKTLKFSPLDSFNVYVRNSQGTWILLFSTELDGGIIGSLEFNLSEYISLDNGVQIRGECVHDKRNEQCLWDNINITSYEGGGANSPPEVNYIQSISVSPNEATIASVVFDVNVSDPDGYGDINEVEVQVNNSLEPLRVGSCTFQNSLAVNTANYSCSVDMWYYDAAGDWSINVTATDSVSQIYTNLSETFIYQPLKAIVLEAPGSALVWGSLAPGTLNSEPINSPTIVNNTGNYEGPILITGYDLVGQTISSETIESNLFRADTDLVPCDGTQLQDSTQVSIVGATLPRGSYAIEEIYYCLTFVPNVAAQDYSASGANAWIIEI